jgi:hypothetical protein
MAEKVEFAGVGQSWMQRQRPLETIALELELQKAASTSTQTKHTKAWLDEK